MSQTKSLGGTTVTAGAIFLLLVSLAGNAFLGSMYWQTRQELTQLRQDPNFGAKEDLDQTLEEVSRIVNLPEGIVPIVATVNNAESLRGRQEFFEDAQNGDKMLLYSNATASADRKAYLYRPATQQLINVAPINISGQIQPQEDTFTIDIRNGTGREGLETQMESLLARVFPNATVTARGLAANDDYEASVLVQANASNEMAQKFSQLFNVPIVELPDGESPVGDTDLVLILGSSQEEAAADTSPAPEASPSGQE